MKHTSKAAARKILRNVYGDRKYRITATGEIHVYGSMPNAEHIAGWSLYGWLNDPATDARLQMPTPTGATEMRQISEAAEKLTDLIPERVRNVDALVEWFADLDKSEANSAAAGYAIQAAVEAGFGVTEENIEGQLECLADHGITKFDHGAAFEIALSAIQCDA